MTEPDDESTLKNEPAVEAAADRPRDRFAVAAGAALITLALVGAVKAAPASGLVN